MHCVGAFRPLRSYSRFVYLAQEEHVGTVAGPSLFAESLDRLRPFLDALIVFGRQAIVFAAQSES
jgi:hypothetical protein